MMTARGYEKRQILTGLLLLSWVPFLVAVAPYKITDTDPAGKQSAYTPLLPKLLNHWPPEFDSLNDPGPVTLRAIQTPGHPHYIGMAKHFIVQVPIEKVVQVTEDFENYPKIWENVLEVKVNSRDGNRAVTEWTRKRPAFFMPKIHYTMLYLWDKSAPGRVVYRQQLIDGNAMYFSDGLVVLDKVTDTSTRLTVVDFFDANFGPFRGLIEGVIWKKSMENSYKDDIAFRARLEHPDWSLDRITEEAEKALDQHPIAKIEYTQSLKFD